MDLDLVDKLYGIVTSRSNPGGYGGECRLWEGSTTKSGYGKTSFSFNAAKGSDDFHTIKLQVFNEDRSVFEEKSINLEAFVLYALYIIFLSS